MSNYRIEAGAVVGCVTVEKGFIKEAPPIWKVFKGQPVINLIDWLHQKTKKVKIESLGD